MTGSRTGPARRQRVSPVEEFGTGDGGRSPVRSDVRVGALASWPFGIDVIDREPEGEGMTTLGIDLAVRAAHVATLADDRGGVMWRRRRFHNTSADLAALSAAAGPAEELTVVMEPTRNAWVLVAPQQSADLRRYYEKHTKNDQLDSVLLSRLPLLHPDGLAEISDLGPAAPLKRAVRRRVNLVADQLAVRNRIDAMLDLLGPSYAEAVGVADSRTSIE